MAITTIAANLPEDNITRTSPQFVDGKFRNAKPMQRAGFLDTVRIMWNFTFYKPDNTVPAAPIDRTPTDQIRNPSGRSAISGGAPQPWRSDPGTDFMPPGGSGY